MRNSHFKRSETCLLAILLAITIGLVSCMRSRDRDGQLVVPDTPISDTLSTLVQYENTLFLLPSPHQVMLLVGQQQLPFDERLANSPMNYVNYTSTFQRALNLGVYGTNLSYFNIYDRTQLAIQHLSVIKQASEDLSLSHTFNANFFAALQKNMGARDSLLLHLSKTYRKAHGYLQESDRPWIGALIITGAWVESAYILTQVAKNAPRRELINRIGQQKFPVANIIEILTPHYFKSSDFSKLTQMFIELSGEFDGVIYTYTYREPQIDIENRTTFINSQSRVVMSDFHREAITKHIETIRNFIVE